ncbi:MAG: histidine kinase [Gemmatimonadaceae bacterium]
MTTRDIVTLIHLVGFLTGIALYAMLAVMIARRWSGPTENERGADAIPFATAAMGLLWNFGALFLYALRDTGLGEPRYLAAASFSALGFLPAFVVHSALPPGTIPRVRRWLVGAAYTLSAVAAALNFASSAAGEPPQRLGLLLLSIGFVLILGVIAVALRGRHDARRTLTVVALAAFAVSAFHLSTAHSERSDAWALALIGHHASIPLALVILYQDYRFALVDIVLRRALGLVALVAVASLGYATVAAPLLALALRSDLRDVLEPTAIIGLVVVTALLYPTLQRMMGLIVDRAILRRGDYPAFRRDLAEQLGNADTPPAILATACDVLGRVLGVTVTLDPAAGIETTAEVEMDRFAYTARVTVPTNDAPSFVLQTAALHSGRRFLSDDLVLLEQVGALVGRRIDAVRVTNERVERDFREQEALRLAAEAELHAMRAQLQPHFLFNALTTIAHLMREAPERALATLYQLTALLRAVLRSPTSGSVTVREELEIVEAYLAIERARFEDRLQVELVVPDDVRTLRIPPLLLQPLVENAVKHGIGPLRGGGRIRVTVRPCEPLPGCAPASGPTLALTVEDTGAGVDLSELMRRRAQRVGLASIERRLQRQFGVAASLTIESTPGRGTCAEIRVPAAPATPAGSRDGQTQEHEA